jgi:catalase
VLVTDGTDARVLADLRAVLDGEGVTVELLAPKVGGVVTSDGAHVRAQQKIDGGPSVLYDAVAVLADESNAGALAGDLAARDFVSDAFAHCKVIGYVSEAAPLLGAVGVRDHVVDHGVVDLRDGGMAAFVERCRAGRVWAREALVHQS